MNWMYLSREWLGVYLTGGHLKGNRGGDRRTRWASEMKLFGYNRLSKFLVIGKRKSVSYGAAPHTIPRGLAASALKRTLAFPTSTTLPLYG